jgi:hypothetical protein
MLGIPRIQPQRGCWPRSKTGPDSASSMGPETGSAIAKKHELEGSARYLTLQVASVAYPTLATMMRRLRRSPT